jgi:NitT/TauT family transport system permease protein
MTTTATTVNSRAELPQHQQRQGSSRLSSILLPLFGTVGSIALWWGVTVVFDIDSFFLPAPPDVIEALSREPVYMFQELWHTLYEVLVGFAIALVSGLTIAVLLTALPVVERATMPMFVALNSIPKAAIAPLLVVWLGFGTQPKIVMVVLICFFPIVVSTMAGLNSTPAELSELGRSMSASWGQMFLKVRLRWALPHVFVGLKVAITLAVVGAIVAEIANPGVGLGSVIVISGSAADTPLAFACIALLAVMSVALFYTIVLIERLTVPWAREITG